MAEPAVDSLRSAFFSFNCSLPKEGQHFIRSPPVRGTLDIAWSCFAVLILSTWETLLFYVPKQVSTTNTSQRYKARVRHLGARGGMMLATLFAPEFLFALAVMDFFAAWQLFLTGKDWASRDGVPWTLKHAYFTVIRGFEAENSTDSHKNGQTPSGNAAGAMSNATSLPKEGDFSCQGRASLQIDHESDMRAMVDEGKSEVIWPISGEKLLRLRTRGWITSWPNVPTSDLDDKDKGDFLIKVLAIAQILWLTLQFATRHRKGLPTTQLEIVVIAYAAMSFLIRAVSWQRPRDIQTTIRIKTARHLKPHEMDEVRNVRDFDDYWIVATVLGFATGVIFGGLHYLA